MTEVDGMEFYQRVTDDDHKFKEFTLVHQSNAELTVKLQEVDRKKILDEINRLPEEMLQMLSEAEDEEEAEEMAEEQNMLSGVNGQTIMAFENICAMSMTHDDLTQHNMEDMVTELDFEVLFEMGARIIELSFAEQGSIKDFREADTGKNS
jgi:hypothetical protein